METFFIFYGYFYIYFLIISTIKKMKKLDLVSIFVKNASLASWLKDSLSKFSAWQNIIILSDEEEALELLNHQQTTLLFVNQDEFRIVNNIKKPHFIIPICEKKSLKMMSNLLQKGCFDILFLDHPDENLKNILGKILHIQAVFQNQDKHASYVNEPALEYNKSQFAQYIFTDESIFLPPTKTQPSIRLLLNDILYIQLIVNKITFFMANGDTFERRKSLNYFINKLPKNRFQKINQKTIVNVNKIDQIKRNDICSIGDITFKITRSFKANLKNKLPL